jgi:hypothetical protein
MHVFLVLDRIFIIHRLYNVLHCYSLHHRVDGHMHSVKHVLEAEKLHQISSINNYKTEAGICIIVCRF